MLRASAERSEAYFESTIGATPSTSYGVWVGYVQVTSANKADVFAGHDTLGGKALKAGTDYAVSYKDNKKLGTETVTVSGKGNYEGSAKATFKIVLGEAKAPAAKLAPKSSLKVSWKKVKGAKSYQLSYRQAGGTWETVAVKGASKTVKGLKAGRVYQFRVRAVAGTFTGSWSKATTCKLAKAKS